MNKFDAELRYIRAASMLKADKFNEKIGTGIRCFRESFGLSQRQLADKAKFCKNTVTQIELGQRERCISLKTVYRILNAFDSSLTLEAFLDACKLP